MYRSNFYLHNPYKYEKHSKITWSRVENSKIERQMNDHVLQAGG
jgi:hypothetical protein